MQREIEGVLQVCLPEKEAQRKPNPGNIQEKLAWGSEQPEPVEDIPDHGGRTLKRSFPTQVIL